MTVLAIVLTAFSQAVVAQYPAKPIRMVVPLAAASAVDNAARIVAQRMADIVESIEELKYYRKTVMTI